MLISITPCLNFDCEGGKYRCPRCGKGYKYRPGLSRHKAQYCGQQPRFNCHLCPYQARQKIHLQNHLAAKHMLITA
ncbi:hypothetical protein J6590_014869 [Homalodisca vitripennis]|nr:hypothetical protein J6590_014869 [Homalodisca vitripennis]